jgi:putative DNA primase/helicase
MSGPLVNPYVNLQDPSSQAQSITTARGYLLTPLGNAERLVDRHGQDLRYCPEWNKWLVWNGKRWKIDADGEVARRAQETVRSIYQEARQSDPELQGILEKHARRSETKYNLDSMISLAGVQLNIPVSPDQLDRDPMLFNCSNGTINLTTGTLLKHSPSHLITKISPVEFRAGSACPTWTQFLRQIFDGDAALIEYLQKAIGYALTGKVTEKSVFILYGNGDNGKTTLLEAVRYILADYAGVVDIHVLMQDAQNSERERAVANMLGKRFITASETEEGDRFNEAKLKSLTGMGRLVGRRIYGSAFEFDPTFKLFIDANHKPLIRGSDRAIWNRIRLVPLNVSIPKDQQDKALLAKLKAEAPGILAWLVEGCLKWQSDGLTVPPAMANATQSYQEEMDPVADFILERCDVTPTATEKVADLYQAFKTWCDAGGEEPLSKKAFGLRLDAKGFPSVRQANARLRQGLKLKPGKGGFSFV